MHSLSHSDGHPSPPVDLFHHFCILIVQSDSLLLLSGCWGPSRLNAITPANTEDVRYVPISLGWEDPLEKEMATHSSILAWEIPWTEEPGGLQSMRSQRVRMS